MNFDVGAHLSHWLDLGLSDAKGQPLRLGITMPLEELLHELDRDRSRAAFADHYPLRALREEAMGSAALAGARMARPAAREMLRAGTEAEADDARMIFGVFLALRQVRMEARQKLTSDRVVAWHDLVMGGDLRVTDGPGRRRRVQAELAGGSKGLETLCAYANGDMPGFFVPPLIRALVVHQQLMTLRPFADGNGRTARAVFYAVMLSRDYPLFELLALSPVIMRAPDRYREALPCANGDLTPFVMHQAGVIREAWQEVRALAEHQAALVRKFPTQFEGLNPRQQALLAHALEKPRTRYRIAAHQHSHGVTHQTARDDLFDLVQRGWLTTTKEGRTYAFQAAADLKDRLAVRRRPAVKAPTTSPPPAPDEAFPINLL